MWSVYGNSYIWDVVRCRSVFVNSVDVHAALAGWMRFDMVLHCIFLIADANAALAGWMHYVCADLAGCYENPVWCSVRLW